MPFQDIHERRVLLRQLPLPLLLTMKMKRFLKRTFSTFGFNPYHFFVSIKRVPAYVLEYFKFKHIASNANKSFGPITFYPCLFDKGEQGGNASGHYFWQDLVVAQRIYLHNPESHLDIGSRIDGFVAHVASFRCLDVLDIRPVTNIIPNVSFVQGDISDPSLSKSLRVYDSVSCLHVLEHCGLGRYGDKLDLIGHEKAAKVISSLVSNNGRLYLSTPIGTQRIEFNAHRVFSPLTIVQLFEKFGLYLSYLSIIDDRGNLIASQSIDDSKSKKFINLLEYDGLYGCGVFEFVKL